MVWSGRFYNPFHRSLLVWSGRLFWSSTFMPRPNYGSSGTWGTPELILIKKTAGKKTLEARVVSKFVSLQIIAIGRLVPAFAGFSQVLFSSV